MLILSRKVGERIQIGDDITIVVGRVSNQSVKIGIEAPSDRVIVRSELLDVTPSDVVDSVVPQPV